MNVVVTGADGFVGRRAVRALEGRGFAVRGVTSDLCDRGVGAGARDGGADSVIHLASIVADDPTECERTNVGGTERVLDAMRTGGVKRVLYLSNSAVCGYTPQRNAGEDDAATAPATPVSRSRARAETRVLAAGGTVFRPLFTYGPGDTYFVPRLVRAMRRLPVLVNHGRARLSVVHVDQLAARIVGFASASPETAAALAGGVFHVNDERPVTLRDVVNAVVRVLGVRGPRASVPYGIVRRVAWVLGVAGGRTASAAHRLYLLSEDHWFDASRIAKILGPLEPRRGFAEGLADAAPWYREACG